MNKTLRKTLTILTVLVSAMGISIQALAWGATGHRIVGEVAQKHLTVKAAAAVKDILNSRGLPDVANWADDIRSDDSYAAVAPFHYADVAAGFESYGAAPKNPKGDVVVAINLLTEYLKTGNSAAFDKVPAFPKVTKEQALKLLVHFVGDVHQPLHAGDPADHGGNNVRVYFMNTHTESNLHSVWDTDIIDYTKLSYTEYANFIDHPSKSDLAAWGSLNPADWDSEGVAFRTQIYIYPDKQPSVTGPVKAMPLISYVYIYKNRGLMETRLLQGGIRLANLLNSIFQ